MKKIILSTVAVMALGFTPAFAEDHGHVAGEHAAEHATEAAPAVQAETAATETKAVEAQTIADLAAANAELGTLVSALTAAGLTEQLKGSGPFTVFAPTNAAFEKLGQDKVADLLKPENKDKLAAILKYHVVPGKIAAVDAKDATVDLTTLNGAVVKVDGKGDVVKVGDATVSQADIVASNGIVHMIDTVILPPEAETAKQN